MACPSRAGLGTWRSEKEIPICHAGPAHRVAFKVTVVAASQARVVSKGLVRYGCGTARYGPHHARCGPE